jgi:hypothetical protein
MFPILSDRLMQTGTTNFLIIVTIATTTPIGLPALSALQSK